ncbi:unnamed protein product [Closterium sp. NIES-54]
MDCLDAPLTGEPPCFDAVTLTTEPRFDVALQTGELPADRVAADDGWSSMSKDELRLIQAALQRAERPGVLADSAFTAAAPQHRGLGESEPALVTAKHQGMRESESALSPEHAGLVLTASLPQDDGSWALTLTDSFQARKRLCGNSAAVDTGLPLAATAAVAATAAPAAAAAAIEPCADSAVGGGVFPSSSSLVSYERRLACFAKLGAPWNAAAAIPSMAAPILAALMQPLQLPSAAFNDGAATGGVAALVMPLLHPFEMERGVGLDGCVDASSTAAAASGAAAAVAGAPCATGMPALSLAHQQRQAAFSSLLRRLQAQAPGSTALHLSSVLPELRFEPSRGLSSPLHPPKPHPLVQPAVQAGSFQAHAHKPFTSNTSVPQPHAQHPFTPDSLQMQAAAVCGSAAAQELP